MIDIIDTLHNFLIYNNFSEITNDAPDSEDNEVNINFIEKTQKTI